MKELIIGKRLIFLYAVVVTLLTACSLYSAYSVIESFIYDNVVTSVETQTVRNILPFMQFMTIQYAFFQRSVFPESWSLNQTELENLLPINASNQRAMARVAKRTSGDAFYQRDKFGEKKLSLESLVDVAVMTEIIAKLDNQFVLLVDKTSKTKFVDSWAAFDAIPLYRIDNSTGALKSDFSVTDERLEREILAAVDTFIASDYGERLVEETLGRIGTETARVSTIPTEFYADWLTYNSVTLTVPLNYFSNLTTSASKIFDFQVLPMHYDDGTNTSNGSAAPPALVPRLWFSRIVMGQYPPSGMEHTIEELNQFAAAADDNKTAEIQLFVKNIGIHDSTQVRAEGNCSFCGNLTSVTHCVLQCRHDWIVDSCGCVPFTYRRFYRDDAKRSALPKCTRQHYYRCYQSGRYKWSPCDYDICVPCVQVENSYEFKKPSSATDLGLSAAEPPYKLKFRIISDQNTYIIFMAKWSNSWMEMLGQVGGNLGIFLGFSFFSLWQAVVFTHRNLAKLKKERKKSRSSRAASVVDHDDPVPTPPTPTNPHLVGMVLSSWLRVAQLGNDGPTEDDGDASGGGSWRQAYERMSKRFNAAEEKINVLETELKIRGITTTPEKETDSEDKLAASNNGSGKIMFRELLGTVPEVRRNVNSEAVQK